MQFSGTKANINSALSGLIYAPTANYNGVDTLSITADDGTTTDTDTVAITVNAVNDAPVNSVPGAQSTNEDTNLTFSTGNGNLISIADVDHASVDVSLLVSNGTLTLSQTTGLTFSIGDGTSDVAMQFSGTKANINAALAGLVYSPTANYNGVDTLSITSDDGTATDTDTIAITVNAVNDAPVNSVPGAQSGTENSNITFASIHGNLISVSDVDLSGSSIQVQLTVSYGSITLASTSGLLFTVGDGTSDSTMTFSGDLSDLNNALDGLTYVPNNNFNGTDTLTMVSNDLGHTGSGGAQIDTDSISLVLSGNNDAPVNSVPAIQNGTENNNIVFSSGNGNLVSISDPDAGSSSLQVQLTLLYSTGKLSLSSVSGLTFSVGDGSLDTTMTFTGTLTNINNALDGLTYVPNLNSNNFDQITITTSDQGNTGAGGVLTDSDDFYVFLTGINDAPVASVPSAQTINEDNSLTLSSGNGNLVSVSDADVSAASLWVDLSVSHGTLTLSQTTNLSFSIGDGTADTQMVFAGAVTDINNALNGLIYTPYSDYNGSDSLVIALDDAGSTGTGGTMTSSTSLNITISAVNDAPTSVVPGTQSIAENNTLTFDPFMGTGTYPNDTDIGSGNFAVQLSVSHGVLTLSQTTGLIFTVGDGTADTTMSFTGSAVDSMFAMWGMVYTPDTGFNGTDTFTLYTSDQGNTGSGGVLTDTANMTINISGANDDPVIHVPLLQTTNLNTPITISSGAGNQVYFTDPDIGNGAMTVQLQVTAAGNNTSYFNLTTTSGLSITSSVVQGSGYSYMLFDCSLTDCNTALNGMIYTPAPGLSYTENFSIIVKDNGNSGTGGDNWVSAWLNIDVLSYLQNPRAPMDSFLFATQKNSHQEEPSFYSKDKNITSSNPLSWHGPNELVRSLCSPAFLVKQINLEPSVLSEPRLFDIETKNVRLFQDPNCLQEIHDLIMPAWVSSKYVFLKTEDEFEMQAQIKISHEQEELLSQSIRVSSVKHTQGFSPHNDFYCALNQEGYHVHCLIKEQGAPWIGQTSERLVDLLLTQKGVCALSEQSHVYCNFYVLKDTINLPYQDSLFQILQIPEDYGIPKALFSGDNSYPVCMLTSKGVVCVNEQSQLIKIENIGYDVNEMDISPGLWCARYPEDKTCFVRQ